MSGRIRTVIADDEPPGRRTLQLLLAQNRDFRLVAECASGAETVDAVHRLRPDLLFLDVQMPGGDGFDVVSEIAPEAMPLIVFVTAYDEYTLRAFDVHAADYLLKPFTDRRFRAALTHVKERLAQQRIAAVEHAAALLRAGRGEAPAPPESDRLAIRTGQGSRLVAIEDIDWVEARGDYVRIHTGERADLVRETISAMTERLAPKGFLRVHRSALVNMGKVRELKTGPNGEHLAVLRSGSQCRLSRAGRRRIDAAIGRPL